MQLADEYDVKEMVHSCVVFMWTQITTEILFDHTPKFLFEHQIFQVCFGHEKFIPMTKYLVMFLAYLPTHRESNRMYLTSLPAVAVVAIASYKEAIQVEYNLIKPYNHPAQFEYENDPKKCSKKKCNEECAIYCNKCGSRMCGDCFKENDQRDLDNCFVFHYPSFCLSILFDWNWFENEMRKLFSNV